MDFNSLMMMSISGEELQEAKQKMIESVYQWVVDRYPKIRLETLERNLTIFLELKKHDDACKTCMSVQTCPGNGCKMDGRLMADGVVSIWMEQCPSGHRSDRRRPDESAEETAKRKWGRKPWP